MTMISSKSLDTFTELSEVTFSSLTYCDLSLVAPTASLLYHLPFFIPPHPITLHSTPTLNTKSVYLMHPYASWTY